MDCSDSTETALSPLLRRHYKRVVLESHKNRGATTEMWSDGGRELTRVVLMGVFLNNEGH